MGLHSMYDDARNRKFTPAPPLVRIDYINDLGELDHSFYPEDQFSWAIERLKNEGATQIQIQNINP